MFMETAMSPLCRGNMEGGRLKPRVWEQASIVCIDIVNFTSTCGNMEPDKVCSMLTKFYERMDALSTEHKVFKVDIIGDAYIGLACTSTDAVRFCLDAVALAGCTMWDEDDLEQGTLIMRCAVHTGKVTGLVLNSAAFKYTLVGETYVVAKKLETDAVPGRVHCSALAVSTLDDAEFHVVCQSLVAPITYAVTRATVMCNTVVCPSSLRFMSVSDAFVRLFGFERRELLSLRTVYGPLTHPSAVKQAMDQCFQFDYGTRTAVILYDRLAMPMCTALEFQKDSSVMMGVQMKCTTLDRTSGSRGTTPGRELNRAPSV